MHRTAKILAAIAVLILAASLLCACEVCALEIGETHATLTYLGGTPGNELYRYDYKVVNNSLEPAAWGFLIFFDSDGVNFLGDRSDFVSVGSPASWDPDVYEDPDPAPWFIEWINTDYTNPIMPGNFLEGFSVTFLWKDLVCCPDVQHFEIMNGGAYSGQTVVVARIGGICSNPPYRPILHITPPYPQCPLDTDNLVVTVTGPIPADPDGDLVTYTYEWFVDAMTGYFVADSLAGRGEHTGNIIPGSDTHPGDIWMVRVTPVDQHCLEGPYAEVTWQIVDGPTATVPMSWGKMKAIYR